MAEKAKKKKDNSSNYLKYILIAVVLLIAAYFTYNYFFSEKKENKYTVKQMQEPQFVKQGELEFLKKGTKEVISKIEIEIAETEQKTQQGLMYRKSMDENKGMLFIFPIAANHAFWMKNTYISLDILFVDKDRNIIKIHKNTIPLSTKDLPSEGPTMFVVEVVAGYTDKFGIKEGDMINYSKQY